MPTVVLKVAGVVVNRAAENVRYVGATIFNPESADVLEFHEFLPERRRPGFDAGATVELLIDGTRHFWGRIDDVSDERPLAGGGLAFTYKCVGGQALLDDLAIESNRGIGERFFNLEPRDPDYDAGAAGRELGQIVRAVFEDVHDFAERVWNSGVQCDTAAPPYTATDPPELKAATQADLDLMTTVPRRPVRFRGSRFWTQVQAVVREWAPTFQPRVYADGTLRFTDNRTLDVRTLTEGDGTIRPPAFRRDTADCATAVQMRGRDVVEGMWLTLEQGDLAEDWTEEAEDAWTIFDFETPTDGYDQGDVVSMTSTTVTVISDIGAVWLLNHWSDIQAHITVIDPNENDSILYQETRGVISSTASVGAGSNVGQYTVTVDAPFANGSGTAWGYERFIIVGNTPASIVHRRYSFVEQDIAERIVTRFPFPVVAPSPDGTAASRTDVAFGQIVRSAVASIFYPGQTFPLSFNLFTDPDDGLIKVMADEPTCKPFTTRADLEIGGEAVVKPDDVRIFAPVSTGAMTARVPGSGFEGTAYTREGIEREIVVDVPEWTYEADRATILLYAQDLLDSLKDVVFSGSIDFTGYDAASLAAGGREAIGLRSDYDGTPGPDEESGTGIGSGSDAFAPGVPPLAVHSVELRWHPSGPVPLTTHLRVSNRTRPWHGEQTYVPRGFLESSPMGGGSILAGGFAGGSTTMTAAPASGGSIGGMPVVTGPMTGGGMDPMANPQTAAAYGAANRWAATAAQGASNWTNTAFAAMGNWLGW
jgi:hypothetical protein